MKSVAHILKSKADAGVHSIAPTASVYDALKLMAEKNIGALLVMEGADIVGIVTERDYARKIALLGQTPHFTQALKDLTVRRMRCQPTLIQIPELGIRLVGKLQPLVRSKNRNGNGQTMQRFFMRVDMLLKQPLRLIDICHINRKRSDAVAHWYR